MPAGIVVDYAGTTAPSGTRFCDGTSYAVATYPALHAAIGYTFGGAGANFNVPDLRGRATFGRDDMGGAAANRITNAVCGITGTTLGAVGGNQLSHQHLHGAGTLATASTGAHTHTTPTTDVGSDGATTGPNYDANRAARPSIESSSAGTHTHTISGSTANNSSAGASENVPPAMMMNKIITTGGVI
jgi:microcystin-dependent protein